MHRASASGRSAQQVVLATGALERPLVFADNDRPGIMLASAVRAYLNGYGAAPGRRMASRPTTMMPIAPHFDARAVGIEVAAVVDCRANPGALAERARDAGIPVRLHSVVRAPAAGSRRGRTRDARRRAARPAGVRSGRDVRRLESDGAPVQPVGRAAGVVGGARRFVPGAPCQAERSAERPGACSIWRDALPMAARRRRCRRWRLPGGPATAAAGADEPPQAPLQPLWWVRGGAGKAFVDFRTT